MDSKVAVATEILKQKSILFGSFSATLSKQDKIETWKGVTVFAKAVGLLGPEKEWKYLRDTIWSNWKKRTLVITLFLNNFLFYKINEECIFNLTAYTFFKYLNMLYLQIFRPNVTMPTKLGQEVVMMQNSLPSTTSLLKL